MKNKSKIDSYIILSTYDIFIYSSAKDIEIKAISSTITLESISIEYFHSPYADRSIFLKE